MTAPPKKPDWSRMMAAPHPRAMFGGRVSGLPRNTASAVEGTRARVSTASRAMDRRRIGAGSFRKRVCSVNRGSRSVRHSVPRGLAA